MLPVLPLGVTMHIHMFVPSMNKDEWPASVPVCLIFNMESVVDLICKTREATVPKTAVKLFHNQKPWITGIIRDAINTQTVAYNLGLQSGNMDN